MTDPVTGKQLVVTGHPGSWSSIKVSEEHRDKVLALLAQHAVEPHWADENVLSFNGGPYMTRITMGRDVDAAAVQRLLDAVE